MAEASSGRDSSTLLVLRSWFFNRDAEEAGLRLSWIAAVLCVLLSALASAFPFSLGRYREARSLADPARWPGLGSALIAAAREGGDFVVKDGIFHPDPASTTAASPASEGRAGDWRVVLDGGETWSKAPDGAILRFGASRVTVSYPATKSLLDGPASALEGVTGEALRRLAENRPAFTVFVKGFLSSLASAEVPGAILAASLLMIFQTAIFSFVLGLLLALSSLRVLHAGANTRQGGGGAKGFLASIGPSFRTVAAVSTGPALLAAFAGSLIGGAGPALAWLGYSLILGLRVVLIYMGRMRDKKTAASVR